LRANELAPRLLARTSEVPMSDRTGRSGYEDMARGDLINELRARDKVARGVESQEALDALKAQNDALRGEIGRMRRERQRRSALEAYYETVFYLAPVAYCILDHSGGVLETNHAVTALFQVGRERLVGRRLTDVVTTREPAGFAEHLTRCLDRGQRVSTVLHTMVRPGDERILHVIGTSIFPEDGTKPTCLTVFADVTHIWGGRVSSETSKHAHPVEQTPG
jgi:PAS domain S-box-containing protein